MRSADGEREPRWPVSQIVGLTLLAVSALCAAVVATAMAPYAIERPGPVFDVLADTEVDGQAVPLIEIVDTETYATDGALNMLTINANNPDNLPTWLEVVEAYFDPSRAVVPIEALYPPSNGTDYSGQQATQMENSKQSAIAAALDHLGYELDPELRVAEVFPGEPADGVLQVDDIIVTVNGTELADVGELREIIAENGIDQPATIVVDRDGERMTLEATPRMSDETPAAPVLGVSIASAWDWPIDVRIQLENVGGPSAGMMFALGIIDKLTPDSLTGGKVIAGTGTIDATGEVGPIGGIRQKLYGALGAGAEWFLAPASNCDEVVGAVPDGLRVTAVATLDDAIDALDVIASDGDTAALPTCESVLAG